MSPRKWCMHCGDMRNHERGRCVECQPEPNPVPMDSETLDIFGIPLEAPAQRHSETSIAAAEAIRPTLSPKRIEVLAYICEFFRERGHGPTHNEVVAHFQGEGWSINTLRARCVELHKGVKDKATGKRRGGGWIAPAGQRDGNEEWIPTQKAWDWINDQREAA